MKYLLLLGVLIYMFLSTSVAAKIGIKEVGTYSTLIIVFFFVVKLVKDRNHRLVTKFKAEFRIILLGLFIIFFKIILGQFDQLKQVLFYFIIPMMLFIVLGTESKSNKNTIKNLILVFFVAECFLAIYERIFLTNVFPYIEEDEINLILAEDWSFRSTAFLGNPLANALCVSTLMGFISLSTIKLSYKMILLILGFVSLLCFNARGATLIWTFLLVLYVMNFVFSKRTKNLVRVGLVLFLIIASSLLYIAVFNYGVGGRLIKEDIDDDSARARVDVFDAFSYIDANEFWYGNSEKYTYIMHKLGVAGVENSYIVLIINYGIILFVVICFVYFLWFKQFLKPYTVFDKFIIFCSFLVVGSTNNNLAGSGAWGFLVLGICCFSFIEKKQKNNWSNNKFNLNLNKYNHFYK